MVYLDAHIHVEDMSPQFPSEHLFFLNATGEADWELVETFSKQPNILPFYGIHPWFLSNLKTGWEERLKQMLIDHPLSGVGEIGLDRFKKETPVEQQRDIFRLQLSLALKLKRPVVIHCVRAWDILFDVLENLKIKKINGILHRFEGSQEILKKLLDYGFYISFYSTLHTREKIKDAFCYCDSNKILLESDAGNGPLLTELMEHYKKAALYKKMDFETFTRMIVKNGEIFKNQAFSG